jgi:hypothetical protein
MCSIICLEYEINSCKTKFFSDRILVHSSGENLSPIPIYGGNGNGTEIFKDGTEWD